MADSCWVVNASPLIALAKVDRLDLLLAPSRTLVVPEAVAHEIQVGPTGDPASVALAKGFGGEPVPAELSHEISPWGLGRGESAVLCLAQKRGATAIIDDRDARRAAKAMGIPLLGTLGVILRARAEGRVDSASEILKALQRNGLRLNHELVATALRTAFGENWEP
jgi:predicted nucleic acid-binding protein